MSDPQRDVRQWVLQSSGLRIEPMMGEYLLNQAQHATAGPIAIMGGDARTGVPVRRFVQSRDLQPLVERQRTPQS